MIKAYTIVALVAALLIANQAPATTNRAVRTTQRDPFWPVGFAPQAANRGGARTTGLKKSVPKQMLQVQNLSAEDEKAVRQQLHLQGTLKFGDEYVAMINNRILHVGARLRLKIQQKVFNFRLRSIALNNVQLQLVKDSANLKPTHAEKEKLK